MISAVSTSPVGEDRARRRGLKAGLGRHLARLVCHSARRAIVPRGYVDQGDHRVLLFGGDDLLPVRSEERVVWALERDSWLEVAGLRPWIQEGAALGVSPTIKRLLPSSAIKTGPGSTLGSDPGARCAVPVPRAGEHRTSSLLTSPGALLWERRYEVEPTHELNATPTATRVVMTTKPATMRLRRTLLETRWRAIRHPSWCAATGLVGIGPRSPCSHHPETG